MVSFTKLRALSARERRLLAQSLLLLPVSGLALRLVSLSRWQAILSGFAPRQASVAEARREAPLDLAGTVARMVRAAAVRGPYRAPCLPRAVTVWWLLRRVGLESDIRFGVRRPGGRFEAHAWVECRGRDLDDWPDGGRPFARLERRSTPVETEAR